MTPREQLQARIQEEFDKFFEFDTEDRSFVTSVSCRLFAERMIELEKRDEEQA